MGGVALLFQPAVEFIAESGERGGKFRSSGKVVGLVWIRDQVIEFFRPCGRGSAYRRVYRL